MADYQRQRRNSDEESFFCRFTFGQFFAILMLEVFTLFFVFYLGARYGRDFLGFGKENVVAEKPKDERLFTTDDPEVEKMARELMEKAKTPELKERIAIMLGTPLPKEKEPQKRKPQQTAPQKVEAAPDPMPAPVIADSPAEEQPTGMVRIKSGAGGRYSIQVGSYPQLGEANQVIETWKNKGYPAFMMIADIPDRGRWYRVRIGGFEDRDGAEAYKHELQEREGVEALVVLNEQ